MNYPNTQQVQTFLIFPSAKKKPGPSQVSTKLKQPKIYTDPEKTPWTPQIPVLSNGRWLTNHWLYHWPFKLPCSTRFATKKKNYNFQLQIHFICFFLECLTSHSQKKHLPSKLLIPLTCWVFSKVSSEEDRTLRLKRPSQGPSLRPKKITHMSHHLSHKKKNIPSRKLASYPTEREVRKIIIDSKCHDFGGYVIVPWRVKNLMSLCIILVVVKSSSS